MKQLLVFCACALATGCGDPLVEGDYRGEPLIELSGTVFVNDEVSLMPQEEDRIRVALVWIGADQQGTIAQGLSESAFPARYNLQVYNRPPARAMQTFDDRAGLYAISRIVLYIDTDGDERLNVGERIVGAAPDLLLSYFTSSESTSLVAGPVRSGYQVLQLVTCEDRLMSKSMLAPGIANNEVDLRLESGIAEALTDLDCDQVADDLCYDLLLQVQESPDNQELVSLYESRCDIAFDPEFNNEPAQTEPLKEGESNVSPDNDGEPTCDTDPGLPGCAEEDDPNGERVVTSCMPLLAGAVEALGHEGQREAYWRFSQCTLDFDPCRQVAWNGGEERWVEYQYCIFDAYPVHHDAWCQALFERLGAGGEGGDREFFLQEFERGECEGRL